VVHLRSIGCELLEAALPAGAEALAEGMRGCGALVHAAAIIYTDLPWPRVREVNVSGTEGVFRAAAVAGIPRAVHLSSVAVYGDASADVREEASLEGTLRPKERYARSKREAERVVGEVAEESGMVVAMLRASAIYGERDRLFTPKIATALRFPVQILLGGGRTPLAAVYAGNVAGAVLAALSAHPHGVRPFNVAEDHGVSQGSLYSALAEELGIPFRPFRIPKRVVTMGAKVGEVLGIDIPGAEELPLTRAARLSVIPNPYRSERIRSELGWKPHIPFGEAVRRTAAWIRVIWGESRRTTP
jgi:nucleoside-diphosphate-sugar epimerase